MAVAARSQSGVDRARGVGRMGPTRRGLLVAAAPVTALLAACGRALDSAPPKRAAAGTVEFFHEWDGVRAKLVDEIVADFQATQPTIKITPTLSRGSISMEKIFAAIVAGSPPEVAMVTTHTGAVWAHKGALRWVDDLLKPDRITTDQLIYRATLDLVKLGGRHFGLPCLVAGVDPFLFYNNQVFRQFGIDPARPPRTWQEAEAASAKVTQREGRSLTRIGLVPSERPFFDWLYQNDGRLFSPDGRKVAFDGPQGQETLTWLKDFTERLYGGMAAVREFYQANRTPEPIRGPRLPWYTGKEAMWVTIVSMFFRVNEEEPGFPLGAAQPPFNGKNPRAKVATVAERTWMYVLPQGAKQEAATWVWFKYVTLGEGAKKMVFRQQRPSPVKKFNEERAFRELSPHWPVVLKNLEASVSVPQSPAWDDVRKSLERATGSVLDRKAGVKEALTIAADEAQKALDAYAT